MREQVKQLHLEEAVAQFVEDAEKYVITAGTIDAALKRDPNEEPA